MGKWFADKASAVLVALALLIAGVAVGAAAIETAGLASSYSGKEYVPSESVLLDLNTATEAELCEFALIDEYYAHEIVRYRKQKGGFKSVDEVDEIFGIGEKRMRAIERYVIIK
ncbi:MAG: helix-hairpin-helix domain-containing protein [Ruminococcus sp.]|nr:helix-hairpin-helix domain-containing protein [Ruminococcus sp.]